MREHIAKSSWLPWLIWLLAASVHFFQGCVLAFPTALATAIKTTIVISTSALGSLFAIFLLANLSAQLPTGALLDNYGNKRVLCLSIGLMSLGCASFAITHNFITAVISQCLLGLGAGMSYITVINIGKEWLAEKYFPIILYATALIGSSGFILSSSLYSMLYQFQSFQLIATELVVLGSLILILISSYLPVKNRSGSSNLAHFTYQDIVNVITCKELWLLGIYVGGVFCQYIVLSNMWRVPYFVNVLKVPAALAAQLNNLTLIGFLVGCWLCPVLSRFIAAKWIMLVAAITQLIILNIIHLFPIDIIRFVLLFLLGSMAAPTLFSYDWIKQLIPENYFGLASGFITMMFYSFGIIIGYLLGFLPHFVSVNQDIYFVLLIVAANIIGVIAFILLCRCLSSNDKFYK